ncbi:hypothetical protein PIROE2DRAFT_68819 [Piromyces sp. E2]|nr:hypothetical protein PIROE2DRAFT_68819 [Piromyces sp. E2]|eukprot:OUM67569.1 hypothetical protein PIROE2DRAFT_68819 [Piromyces sp. E2]
MKNISFAVVLSLIAGFTHAINLDAGSIKCGLAIKKYGTCMYNLSDIKEVDFASACSKFEQDNCKDFLQDVYNTTTDCEGQEDNTLDNLIKQIRYIYISGCSKDENGNLCPLTELIQKREAATINADIISKSCNSANCKRQLNNMIELLPSTKSYVENQNSSKEENEQVPQEWIDSTYKNIDADSLKTYLDSEICSKVANTTNTLNATDANGNPGNQTMANANDNESAAILSLNTNLIFVSLLLITIFNLLF